MFIYFLFFPALTGNKLLIKNISDGEELKELKNQQYFCYQNYKVPGWRETWTRIQVRFILQA